jgi:hypothetical protein
MKPHRNRPRASLRSPAEQRAASLRKSDITFPAVLVVTGASGSGKTTAVRALESRTLKGVRCYYFDTAGVPSPDEMDRGFDGPDQWQATTTQRWFDRFAANADGAAVCVLDGQTRPSFVRTAAERAGSPSRELSCSTARRQSDMRDWLGHAGRRSFRIHEWTVGPHTSEGRLMRWTCQLSTPQT